MARLSAQREANGLFPPPGWDQIWVSVETTTTDDTAVAVFSENPGDALVSGTRTEIWEAVVKAVRSTATKKSYATRLWCHIHWESEGTRTIVAQGKIYESQYPSPASESEEIYAVFQLDNPAVEVLCGSNNGSEGTLTWRVSVRRSSLEA